LQEADDCHAVVGGDEYFWALNIVRFFLEYGLILFRVAYLAKVPMVSIRLSKRTALLNHRLASVTNNTN